MDGIKCSSGDVIRVKGLNIDNNSIKFYNNLGNEIDKESENTEENKGYNSLITE